MVEITTGELGGRAKVTEKIAFETACNSFTFGGMNRRDFLFHSSVAAAATQSKSRRRISRPAAWFRKRQ
jgi:hypothetical protein